jgi:pimeloyl-ACP methyl ester carboxylesterase
MFFSSMRSVTASFTAIALLALTATPGDALLPAHNKPVLPTVIKSSGGLVETGVLGDAPYRIDIPAQWNHSLVVFYHGYAEEVFTYHPTEHLVGQPLPFFERGYAVIQSGYSQPGWALAQAYPETEDLRKYFVKKYGQPTETYVAGGSMGGELTSVTLELNPKPYMGGLDLCGSVGPTYLAFEHRFAIRAAFDHYFPNVMPPLVPVPADYQDNDFERRKIMNALRANPVNATLLRNLMEMHTDGEVAHNVSYYTYVVGDLQRRAGGNPFDNRNTIYTGTTPGSTITDYELNDNVRRYAGDPKAFEYLKRHYTSTGRLGKPMLALHTEFDPIVQVQYLPLYYAEVQAAGAQANFVQQFVAAEGHCNFTTQEIGMAFDELVRWTHGGPQPTAGLMKRPPDGRLSEPPRKPAAAPAGDVKQ